MPMVLLPSYYTRLSSLERRVERQKNVSSFIASIVISWCVSGICWVEEISPEAQAIAACESGNTITLGSLNWAAINVNVDGTIDGGAFQFNNYWVWNSQDRWVMRPVAKRIGITSDALFLRYPSADVADPYVQYQTFIYLWDNGYGWQHWSASRPCWSKWLTVQKGRAVWKN
jgi:hypothetical protein